MSSLVIAFSWDEWSGASDEDKICEFEDMGALRATNVGGLGC